MSNTIKIKLDLVTEVEREIALPHYARIKDSNYWGAYTSDVDNVIVCSLGISRTSVKADCLLNDPDCIEVTKEEFMEAYNQTLSKIQSLL